MPAGKAPLAPAPATELYRHSHISFIPSLSFSRASSRLERFKPLLGTAFKMQLPPRTRGLRELRTEPRSGCPRSCRLCRSQLRSPGVAGRLLGAVIGSSRRFLPLISPADFQGLGAALMSFRPRVGGGDARRRPIRRWMSRVPLPPPRWIPHFARICIICHCAAGPPPSPPARPKCGRGAPLPALPLFFTPGVCSGKPGGKEKLEESFFLTEGCLCPQCLPSHHPSPSPDAKRGLKKYPSTGILFGSCSC